MLGGTMRHSDEDLGTHMVGVFRTGARTRLKRVAIPALLLATVVGGTARAVTSGTLGDDAVVDGGSGEVQPESSIAVLAPASPSADPVVPDEGDPEPGSTSTGPTFDEAVALYGPPDYAAILARRFPGAQWSLNGNDPDGGLVWLDGGPKPTRAELDALWASVGAELAEEEVARAAAEALRAAERAAELEARRSDPTVQTLLDTFDPRTIWGPAPDYAQILSRRFPGAQWSLNGNDPDGGLVWLGAGPKPTRAELDALWAAVAREMALEMDPAELARWAGTGDQIYVDGVLRPRGWVGGADDPQPTPRATPENLQYLPQIPPTNGGSPVGTITVRKDPTGAKNFEQLYGIDLAELGNRIAAAHGYFGGSHGLGLSLNGDRELMWYSDQVDPAIVERVLAGLGALPEAAPDDDPGADPDSDSD
jgi:hypothetical protein